MRTALVAAIKLLDAEKPASPAHHALQAAPATQTSTMASELLERLRVVLQETG